METAAAPSRTFWPLQPLHRGECDLPDRVLLDLFLRRAYVDGTTSVNAVSQELCLSPAIVDVLFRRYRDQRVLDVLGSGEDEDYRFTLTSAGRRLAESRMRASQYVGPAPVSLKEYSLGVRAQAAHVRITPELLQDVLGSLVLPSHAIEKLGPALISQKSLFLYGPTGNGKSAIAEKLHAIYTDTVLVPHALEVDGQIIAVHDPVFHKAVEQQPPDIDPRWVLCRRPFVVVGGELTGDMLEIRFDPASGTYAAPVQMKANNGMLVIDDFGRQMIGPRRLLNRWIVPMDRRLDNLTLRYGLKFQVPFELMLVFATNVNPHELADDAFLRRMPNKIHLSAVTDSMFDEIFDRYTSSHGMQVEPGTASYVRRLCAEAGCLHLRACLPGDLCSIARCVQSFEQSTGPLTSEHFKAAVDLYFADTEKLTDTDFCERDKVSSL